MDQQIKDYQDLLNQKKVFEESLVSIDVHAKGFSEYLNSIFAESNISQWFHIAHGLKNINYDGIIRDSSFEMCRPAYEYEIERQKLYKNLVTEITIFSYLYSGLESVITFLNLKKCPTQKGKINSATYYIKENFNEINITIDGYSNAIFLFEKMFQKSFEDTYTIKSELNNCVCENGIGLRLIYKIRNKLMHGDFFFPEPLDYSSNLPFHPEIINICSRLIMFSLQKLLLTFRKNSFINELEIFNSTILNENLNYQFLTNEKLYLKNYHLKQHDFKYDQIQIKFK